MKALCTEIEISLITCSEFGFHVLNIHLPEMPWLRSVLMVVNDIQCSDTSFLSYLRVYLFLLA